MNQPPDKQLELFDVQHLGDKDSLAAAPPEAVRRLAARLPARLYLGASSWSFPGWQGIVYNRRYPEAILAKEGLAAYARHPLLRTVGIDRSYYAPLSSEVYREYANQAPRHFRFVVKACESCVGATVRRSANEPEVPNPLFLDPDYAAEELVAPMLEGLKEKAGVLLFQFPPQTGLLPGDYRDFRLRLENFLNQLPAGPVYAVELRNRSLLTPDYFQMIRDAPAVHCFNVHPRSLPLDRQVELAEPRDSTLLVRWMLHPGLEYEEAKKRYAPFDSLVDPQPAARSQIAQLCREALDRDDEAFVIVNNKAEGSAPLSVLALAELMGGNREGPTEKLGA